MKTYLYNFDPLKPHFYIIKLGFTGIFFLFLLKNIDCGYSLEPPRRGGSNEYLQSMFWAETWKISEFFIWKFSVFGSVISIYLNRRVFAMLGKNTPPWLFFYTYHLRPRWLSWMRCPTGDQEVAGSTPAEVGNILSWRLIMKYFLRSFSPFRWFKKGSCQFLAKECAQNWLTA